MRLIRLLALPLALMATPALAQPFADGPDAKKDAGPRPERRTWTVKSGDYAFTLEFNPGIPNPNQVVEIQVLAGSIPKTPHPRYGNRIPMEGARITVEAINPAGESIGRFLAHPFALQAGRYGLHVTPTQDGIYELFIQARTAEGEKVEARMKMPVNVWPLPKELEGGGDDVGNSGRRRPVIKK